jgi:hypothetical protein
MPLNIERLLRTNRIYYVPGSSGFINTRCPFCGDRSEHLGWRMDGSFTTCWKCGYHDTKTALRRTLRLSSARVDALLEEYEGHTAVLRRRVRAAAVDLPGTQPLSKFHRRYLESRGFDPGVLESKYQLRGTGPGELWQGMGFELRVVIPVFRDGAAVTFQGRDITDRHPARYLACPKEKSVLDCKETLYNVDNCRTTTLGVVEGVLDCWRFGDGFVATFGTRITPAQIKLLLKFRRLFFVFDPEAEAQERAEAAARRLAALGREVEVVSIAGMADDPGNLSDAQAVQIKKELGIL